VLAAGHLPRAALVPPPRLAHPHPTRTQPEPNPNLSPSPCEPELPPAPQPTSEPTRLARPHAMARLAPLRARGPRLPPSADARTPGGKSGLSGSPSR
jgi:hypothetical protein